MGRHPKNPPPEWSEYPPAELVQLALGPGDPPLHIKQLCGLLRQTPPSDDGIRALAGSGLEPFLLVPIFTASGSRAAYEALRDLARHGEWGDAKKAARGMVEVAPLEGFDELARWLVDDPSSKVRGVAAVGLTAVDSANASTRSLRRRCTSDWGRRWQVC